VGVWDIVGVTDGVREKDAELLSDGLALSSAFAFEELERACEDVSTPLA